MEFVTVHFIFNHNYLWKQGMIISLLCYDVYTIVFILILES